MLGPFDHRKTLLHVGGVALVLSILNVIKPPIIDDGIYLEYANQIVRQPTDPYGFHIVWYNWSVPAIEVLCPPVLPYWLAIWMAIFGSGWVGLKIWMAPWCLLWAWGMMALLRRWAPAFAVRALWMMGLSPLILPGVNMMLDVPMYGLLLASFWAFLEACDRKYWPLAALSGALVGVAVETKFNGLSGLVAIMVYALLFGQLPLGLLACSIGMGIFAAVELSMFNAYGSSHFVCILTMHDILAGQGILFSSASRASVIYFLCEACPFFGVMALWAMGIGRRWLVLGSLLSLGAVMGGTLIPLETREWISASIGVLVLALLVPPMVMLLRGTRDWTPWAWWPKVFVSIDFFLVLWFFIEIGIMLASSPFPAARRYIGPATVMVILLARLVGKTTLDQPAKSKERQASLWIITAASGCLSLTYWICDVAYGYDVQRAYHEAETTIHAQSPGAKIWNSGKWSGMYYGRQLGMPMVEADVSVVRRGEYLIVPDESVVYTPLKLEEGTFTELATATSSDAWPLKSMPEFYGGGTPPLKKQPMPRVCLRILRADRDFLCVSNYAVGIVLKWAIFRQRPLPPASVRAVMDALSAGDQDIQNRVIDVLLRNGPPMLLPALELSDPRKRCIAAILLANFADDPEVAKALSAHVNDPDAQVRAAVKQSMAAATQPH